MTNQNATNRRIFGRAPVILVAVLAALALVLAGCGTDEDDGTVTMARANWNSGHMQAASTPSSSESSATR